MKGRKEGRKGEGEGGRERGGREGRGKSGTVALQKPFLVNSCEQRTG